MSQGDGKDAAQESPGSGGDTTAAHGVAPQPDSQLFIPKEFVDGRIRFFLSTEEMSPKATKDPTNGADCDTYSNDDEETFNEDGDGDGDDDDNDNDNGDANDNDNDNHKDKERDSNSEKDKDGIVELDRDDQAQLPFTTGVRQTQLLMERCRQTQELCGDQPPEVEDLHHWKQATEAFYEPEAKIRTRLWCPDTGQTRSYLLSYEFIPRYLRASFKDTKMKTNIFMGDVDETTYPNGEIIMDAKKLTVIHQVFDEQKYIVKGQLKIHFSPRLKIIFSDFSITYRLEKKTPDLGEPQQAPPPLINENGVTHELMRYMEMAEIFGSLGDIMSITKLMNISPSDGLSRMASAIESHQMMMPTEQSYIGSRPANLQSVPVEAQTPQGETPQTTPNDAGYYQDSGPTLAPDMKRGCEMGKNDDSQSIKKSRR